jgi:hypothetical protein
MAAIGGVAPKLFPDCRRLQGYDAKCGEMRIGRSACGTALGGRWVVGSLGLMSGGGAWGFGSGGGGLIGSWADMPSR